MKKQIKCYIAIDDSILKTTTKFYKTKKEAKNDPNFFYDILIKGKIIEGAYKIKKLIK